jgi:hemoglobin
MGRQPSLYDQVGGMAFFERLVDCFYVHVAADPELLAHYPEPDDLGPARRRLHLFLAQYFGGPTTYSDERGHPRLRQRHMPFVVDADARDRWLRAMRAALDDVEPPAPAGAAMWEYFTMAAPAMQNAERPADGA